MPNLARLAELIEGDVGAGLRDLLIEEADDDGFDVQPEFRFVREERPIADREEEVGVIPWQWTGVHRGPLLGIEPTGRRFTVKGVSLVVGEEGAEEIHRFVDWAPVLFELGVRFYDRPVVDVVDRFGDAITEQPEFPRPELG